MSRVAPPEGLRTTMESPEDATRIVVVRHGEGHVNVAGRIGGHEGCTGLTDRGREQAHAMAARLTATGELAGATAVYSSILGRAIATAEILAPSLGLDPSSVQCRCELCELHPGEADGLTWDEYVERFDAPDFDLDPSGVFAPGGESWNTFVDRSTAGVTAVADAHPGDLVVIATHAGVIESLMLRHLAGSPTGGPHRRLRLQTRHLSLTEWEVADGIWRLQRYNDAVTTGF